MRSFYVCQQCGYRAQEYLGKCPECDSWNSLVEEVEESQKSKFKSQNKTQIINLQDIKTINYKRLTSKIEEFDRVLGGGMVPGSLMLLAGDPGIGKSTLLTQIALNISKALYVAGEESAQQIKLRTERIKPKANLAVLNEIDVDAVSEVIQTVKPSLVIIDSIQTLQTQDLESVPGSVGQVRESAHRLQRMAKSNHVPMLLIGHVTKEGTVAGPKTLEHLVDVVLNMEGDLTTNFRLLRGIKNRFGPTDEVGIFEMIDTGMIEIKNPSKLFLDSASRLTPGSAVVSVMTGQRPLLVEIQALVSRSSLPSPRRVSSGIDNNRLQLLVAVLQKRLGLPLFDQDVFVNVTGGLRVSEPAADLGVAMAIVSSFKNAQIIAKSVFIGEVGLLGEIRPALAMEKRLREAKKLGFNNIISSNCARNLQEAKSCAIMQKHEP